MVIHPGDTSGEIPIAEMKKAQGSIKSLSIQHAGVPKEKENNVAIMTLQ